MKLEEFNYELPNELIAQHPLQKRDESRLLVLDRLEQKIKHKKFTDIIDYLNPGDCIVLNNTKVIPARLLGEKVYASKNSQICKVEFLLLKNLGDDKWETLVSPGKRLKVGAKASFGEGKLIAEVLEITEEGTRIVKFEYEGVFNEILAEIGNTPLPPYIRETLEDKDRYQTIYAKNEGSSAAPTAGLHFTEDLLEKIKSKGVNIAEVTLHVGIGTFKPVKAENIEDHVMHSERYLLTEKNANIINETEKNGGRIFAVGTTSCRVLETLASENGKIRAGEGETNIFIAPGYSFKIVDALITNFHLPKSSLVMLVSALASKNMILNSYKLAIEKKYRFFSFGDAMLII